VPYNEVAIRKAATAAKSPDKETLKARLETAHAEIAQLKERHAPGPLGNGPKKGPEVLGLASQAKLACLKSGSGDPAYSRPALPADFDSKSAAKST
jgi:hypothetical protein